MCYFYRYGGGKDLLIILVPRWSGSYTLDGFPAGKAGSVVCSLNAPEPALVVGV